MTLILSELKNDIGTIIFNNYEKRNALSMALIAEFNRALDEFGEAKARVVVIRAQKGTAVWSAGHDIGELAKPGRDPLSYDNPLEQLLRSIERFPSPVIAMLEGSVWGAACELALTCDILIGTRNVTFAITPAKIGIPYNLSGILHFLNMLEMSVAKEMFFTAQPIDAERAEKLGILNHLVDSDRLESFTWEIAGQICRNSPLSISVIKEQLRLLGKAHPMSPETFERIQGLRRIVYDSDDYREGLEAFLEHRKAIFTGS